MDGARVMIPLGPATHVFLALVRSENGSVPKKTGENLRFAPMAVITDTASSTACENGNSIVAGFQCYATFGERLFSVEYSCVAPLFVAQLFWMRELKEETAKARRGLLWSR